MTLARDMDETAATPPATSEPIAPLPRVSIQAFCSSQPIAALVEDAARDPRLEKAHVKVQMGGAAAAVEAYRAAPTPNVIVLEGAKARDEVLGHLDRLADVTDAGTRVVVIGHINDVVLYREMMRRGISEYLVAPIETVELVRALSNLFRSPGADPVGRTIAVVGAKGGVGASTIAHNLSWAVARTMGLESVVVDLDLPFGTAGLDFNQDPPQGVADAVFAPERVDSALIDRLLSKCAEQLSILDAPATLERVYDMQEDAFDGIIEILRGNVPAIVLDVPHAWTGWTRRTLIAADEVLVVAAPDLANLRNAKTLFDALRQARTNQTPPRLVINMVGVPKRPEIKVADFAKALEIVPAATLAFDPQLFGAASNNGQMIAEAQSGAKVNEAFRELARLVTGRADARPVKRRLLGPLLARFGRKAG
jgi:pilus assembly protein CpaE